MIKIHIIILLYYKIIINVMIILYNIIIKVWRYDNDDAVLIFLKDKETDNDG